VASEPKRPRARRPVGKKDAAGAQAAGEHAAGEQVPGSHVVGAKVVGEQSDAVPASIASDGDAPSAGPELARAVLDAARSKRVQRQGSRLQESGRPGSGRRLRGYSGAGPDPRDPQPLSAVLAKLMKARGWQQPAAEARLFGMWEAVVGPDLASHSRPVMLEDGVLTIEAESTAWATQLRLLTGKLLVRIAGEVGRGVVKTLNIRGPVAPSWAKGPKRVRGRGPRDTYG
jgi:predicted nucleic acid-binding Zn ribbon protein